MYHFKEGEIQERLTAESVAWLRPKPAGLASLFVDDGHAAFLAAFQLSYRQPRRALLEFRRVRGESRKRPGFWQ